MPARPIALVGALIALVLSATGCGGEDRSLDPLLAYLPPDAGVVAALSTDLESEQWEELEDQLLAGPLAPERSPFSPGGGPPDVPQPTTLEGYLRQAASFSGLSYEDDVEPVLGGELVVGFTDARILFDTDTEGTVVIAFDSGDGARMRSILERLEFRERAEVEGATVYVDRGDSTQLAVDGDIVVVAEGTGFSRDRGVPQPALAEALARAEGETLTQDRLEELSGDLDDDALLRIGGDPSSLLSAPELAPLRELPWIDAVTGYGATLSFESDELVAEAAVNTDPSMLSEDDLPLPADAETPELVRRNDEISGASANQSRTTTFLLDAVRAGYPDSRFVKDVEKLERALEIDFADDVLARFNGPSASTMTFEGDFAARSTVDDPDRLLRLMRRLAPDLGRLIQDLQALRSSGLAALFLVAPDAPVAPRVLGDSRIEVSEISGPDDLYEITNLTPPGREILGLPPGLRPDGLDPRSLTPIPDRLVFGLVDEVFVVASDEARAREIARAESEPAPDGVEGASIVAGDLSTMRGEFEERLGFDPGPLGEMAASASASLEALQVRARIELPD